MDRIEVNKNTVFNIEESNAKLSVNNQPIELDLIKGDSNARFD